MSKIALRVLVPTITVAALLAGCSSSTPSAPSTVTAAAGITAVQTAVPVTPRSSRHPTVSLGESVTVTKDPAPTSESASVTVSSTAPAVISAQAPTDHQGHPIAVIQARDHETPGAKLSCNDVLGKVEAIGGQPGGCEIFDQDRWDEIVVANPGGFDAYNKSPNIGWFRGSEASVYDRAYVGLTACEELWVNQAPENKTQVDAAFATMKPIINRWYGDRANPSDIRAALNEAQTHLCQSTVAATSSTASTKPTPTRPAVPARFTAAGGSILPGQVGEYRIVTNEQAINSLTQAKGDLDSYLYLADAALNQFGTPRDIPADQWSSFQFNQHLLAYFQAQETGTGTVLTHADAALYESPEHSILVEKIKGDIGADGTGSCDSIGTQVTGPGGKLTGIRWCTVTRSGFMYAFQASPDEMGTSQRDFINGFLTAIGELGI